MSIDLSMITKGKKAKPPRLVLYGVEGIGKSSFAAEAPETIFISTEDGQDNIDASKFPICKSYDDVIEQLTLIHDGEHKFKTLSIDSLDWLEPLIWNKVASDHKVNNIEDIGYAKGYTYALDYWRDILSRLSAIRSKRNIAIILIAHDRIKRFDSPESEPFDRYELKLHDKAAPLIYEWADAVLFANYRAAVAKTDVGFNKEVKRGIGGGERFIYTEERPAFKAKNRYNLPSSIPFKKGEGWNAFMNAMAANFETTQE